MTSPHNNNNNTATLSLNDDVTTDNLVQITECVRRFDVTSDIQVQVTNDDVTHHLSKTQALAGLTGVLMTSSGDKTNLAALINTLQHDYTPIPADVTSIAKLIDYDVSITSRGIIAGLLYYYNAKALTATNLADVTCALTAERLSIKVDDVSEGPRELLISNRTMRALLAGSSGTKTNLAVTSSCEAHGIARDLLKQQHSDDVSSISEYALLAGVEQVSTSLALLLQSAHARLEVRAADVITSSSMTVYDKALRLQMLYDDVIHVLDRELSLGMKHLNMSVKPSTTPTTVMTSSSTHTTHNNNKKDDDEFKGLTSAQINKILKKRAEKEAKAAAKALKKANKLAGAPALTSLTQALTQALSLTVTNTQTHILRHVTHVLQDYNSNQSRKPKIAKGTRDYLPDQMSIREEAFSTIRRIFHRHGGVEIDTPVFELKETLTNKYGEDSKLIYDLADQGGELLALRYDLTVPFARFLALHNVGHIKRFHIGKVYRRDQPQLSKGRYREFYQCDFDIAGLYSRMVPDAECVGVVCEILSNLNIGAFAVKLNHRSLLDAILDISGVPADKFRTICSAVDKLDKEEWTSVKCEMMEKGLDEHVTDTIGTFVLQKGHPWNMYNKLMQSNKFGDHPGASTALEDLRILFSYLESMNKLHYISFDLSLARGLDYYTGVIYEAVCMNGNTQVGSIGGGGRYDNLVSMFQEAGKVTPCVGVSVGIERVFTLMEERLRQQQNGSIKRPNVKVLVASVGKDSLMHERMRVATILWEANISAEYSQQQNPKLKYELANALERGIPFMVIIGEDELKENKCKVKDLVARTEDTIHLTDLPSFLKGKGVVPVGCEFAAELEAMDAAVATTTTTTTTGNGGGDDEVVKKMEDATL